MKQIWNNFCRDVKAKKSKDALEMDFEINVVRKFLSALGWLDYFQHLEEQKSVYKGKDRADFFLHTKNDSKDRQIVVELKRPEHKQKQKDIQQLERYLKSYGCRFGLYIGEKLEVFFRQPKGDDFDAVSVVEIDYTLNNPAAEDLLNLIKYDNYDKETFTHYCLDNLEVNKYVRHWQTREGEEELYNAVIDTFKLPKAVSNKLQSVLKFQIINVRDAAQPEMPTPAPVEVVRPTKSGIQKQGVEVKEGQPRLFNIATLPRYWNCLNSAFTKEIMKSAGIEEDISDIHDLEILGKLYEEIKAAERQRNIHNTYSCALTKYMEYIKAGLGYSDMEHDAILVKKKMPESKPSSTPAVKPSVYNANSNTWLICYDNKNFDVERCFKKFGQIYWKHKSGLQNVKKGDIAYLYGNRPISAVRFKVEVIESHIPYSLEMAAEDEFSKKGYTKPKNERDTYFLVRPLAENNSSALKHSAIYKAGLIGKRPSTTKLSKDEFKALRQYIEQHFDDVSTKDVVPNKSKRNKRSEPPFKFSMIGLKAGDVVVFDSLNIEVSVASDNTIIYKGKEYKLTTFCKEFLPKGRRTKSNTYRGPDYFSYQGKTLTRLRKEKHPAIKL
ncbi:MAG: type I restriction enzyme HsdR N-terminal domain-containing protein [Bacteroidaceae bacterium]|nr:type I restriction enzyme HsdR N-terminal domain-containing protein [Bacteroidaceae bacterium]